MDEPLKIILDKCVGCGLCLKVCAYDALSLIDKKAVVNEKCTVCGACIDVCKFDAMEIERQPFKGQDTASFSGICIFAEHRRGKLSSVVPEIIGASLALKKNLQKTLSAILLGHGLKPLAGELISYGVDEVWQ
ncbi:Caffeyl-CoA reductase-Etf complex subunit CarE [subsurface metagenome]